MKKIITSILLCFMLFLTGISGVSAASTKDLEITDFKLQSKSSTATVENVSLDNNKVTGTIVLNQVDDFASFTLTFKNNGDDKFKIISVEDNNKIDNISLIYHYDENYIEKGQTASVSIKLRYDKELGQEKLSLDNLTVKINFEQENGSRQSIVVNPTTGDSIIRFIVIGIISLLGAFLIVVKGKRKLGMILLIIASIVLPFAALASEKYEISIKFSNIVVMGKETPVIPDTATLKDGESFNALITSGTGAFRKATAEEYNAAKATLTDNNIASTSGSPAPIYVWNNNGDILYYSDALAIYMNEDSSSMFSNTNLTSIDLSGLNSSKVVDMSYMFKGLGSTVVDFSQLDTSKVTTMEGMFSDTTTLASLNLSGLNTANVENMSSMFKNSAALAELNISTFNTEKVTDMSDMFAGCTAITTLDLSNFNTSSVTDMSNMFYGDTALTALNLSSFNTGKVTNMSYMFSGLTAIETLSVGSFDTSKVTNMNNMFSNCPDLYTIYVSNLWSTTAVQDSTDMFKGDESLLGQEGTEYDESNNDLHYACIDEGTNDPGYFTTEGHVSSIYATIMRGQYFSDKLNGIVGYYTALSSLGQLGVTVDSDSDDGSGSGSGSGSSYGSNCYYSEYNPEDGYNCDYYVPGYDSSEITVKNFRKATRTEYKNAKYFLNKKFIISTIDSPKPVYLWVEGDDVVYYSVAKKIYLNEDCEDMFSSTSLENIDLSGLDSSRTTNLSYMFVNSESLKSVNFDGFDTSKVTDMSDMFRSCNALTELDLSSFSADSLIDASFMFDDCRNLETIYVSDLWDVQPISYGVGSETGYGVAFDTNYMFNNDIALVGQMGTRTNSSGDVLPIVDGTDGLQGLFTRKDVNLAVFITGQEFNDKLQLMTTSGKSFRKATETEYNAVSENLTGDNLVSIRPNLPIYMWETNDAVLYYSSLQDIYLNRDAAHMFENTGFVSIDLGGINSSITDNMASMFEDCAQLTNIVFEDSSAAQIAMMNNNLSASVANVNGGKANTVPIIFAAIFAVVTLGVGVFLFRGIKVNKLKLSVGFITAIVVVISLTVLLLGSGFNKLLASVSTPEETTNATIKFDTSNVTNMSSMFKNCSSLEELDLSTFSIENVFDFDYMFEDCTNLKTIYVSDLWDSVQLAYGCWKLTYYNIFSGCTSLVGGAGTTYGAYTIGSYGESNNYIHVDGGYANPGLLTLKGETMNSDYAYFMEGSSFRDKYHSLDAVYGCGCEEPEIGNATIFRRATESEYNSAKASFTSDNIVSDPNSPNPIYMWKVEEEMLYYSEASTIYMNIDSDSMFEYESSLETIDLSGLDYSAIDDFDSMFRYCDSLVTIYVSDKWQVQFEDSDGYDMFADDYSLVGGAGTVYDENHQRWDYAHIDGGPSNPGYFTLKQ